MIDIRCCDNLELMKEIKDNTIDLIYCDILYGTGRKFKDYQDLKPKRNIIEEHYIPRIKEMHRVLKDTGSIYLQMDTRINHWIRCIMDDIFGYNNFRNEIVWKRSKGVNITDRYFYDVKDYILFYSKSNKYTFNKQYEFLTHASKIRYNKTDEFGKKYMLANIQSKKNFRFEGDFRIFNGKKYYNKLNLGWDWTQKTLEEKINAGCIIEESKNGETLQYRNYLNKSKGKAVNTIWEDFSNITSTANNYDTQKPKALIERIIKASSNEGDLVADFYAGSHTTGDVALELNRKYIGCDINPKSLDVGVKRLQRFL